jgi:hypothetical protein
MLGRYIPIIFGPLSQFFLLMSLREFVSVGIWGNSCWAGPL